jgi:hypothetical protein
MPPAAPFAVVRPVVQKNLIPGKIVKNVKIVARFGLASAL